MEQETFYTDMDLVKAEYPDILSSGGLGPCIAIGVYDPVTRSGYMVHEPNFTEGQVEEMIQRVREDYGDLARLKVFVAGGSLDSFSEEEEREYGMFLRRLVERTLRNYFDRSQLRVKWSPDDCIVELLLDTSKGRFRLETESLEDSIE